MGRFFRQNISISSRLNQAVALGFVLGLAACEDPSPKQEAPTEPWLKDEGGQQAPSKNKYVRYQVAPDQSLSLSLPTRKHKPTGVLGNIKGHVDLTLDDLATSRGEITFGLDSLRMDEEAHDGEPEEGVASRTLRAARWLGLGENVAAGQKEQLSTAHFEFESLRALSHRSAGIGQRKKKEDGGIRRQVYATASGELSLRGLSVHRQFSTTLHFHYAPEAASKDPPDSVEVTIRGDARIPLAEYEIVPRDAQGHPISEQKNILGKEVGTSARVTGSLRFNRVGESASP